MDRNNERLRDLIDEYDLTRREVAEMLGLGVNSRGQAPTVNKWLGNPSDKKNYRVMPDISIELLELKLGARRLRKSKAKSRHAFDPEKPLPDQLRDYSKSLNSGTLVREMISNAADQIDKLEAEIEFLHSRSNLIRDLREPKTVTTS